MDRPRKLDPQGYWRTRVFPDEREMFSCYPNGWTMEHRFVMERELGRHLAPRERVWHLNGDRQDNRPENLTLDPPTGESASAWKGGRSRTNRGYIQIKTPDGRRMLEHRYVMEQKLGRPLWAFETVHHKNGRRDDNRLENLELWATNHPAGASEKHCPTCTCFDH